MRRAEGGFSIVEIMVAAAIALIGIVAIFQVLAVWEERKRTTSSGSDAQVSGTIAMYNMDRDLRQAGFGFGLSTYMGCTVQAYDTSRGTPAFTWPVSANHRFAAGAPRCVLYGIDHGGRQPGLHHLDGSHQEDDRARRIQQGRSGTGWRQWHGLRAGGNHRNNNADALTIDHAAGAYTNYLGQAVTARYNNPAGTGGTFSSGALHNFGPGNTLAGTTPPPRPRRNTWSIRTNNTLAWSDSLNDGNTWFEVAEGIVDLQAEYGVDANNDNMIADTEWVTTTPADWTKVRAVRAAILARSQVETGGNTQCNHGRRLCHVNLADGTAWQNYRYRVYEKVFRCATSSWGTAP
jgi:type IV pilus assembly protein PilW